MCLGANLLTCPSLKFLPYPPYHLYYLLLVLFLYVGDCRTNYLGMGRLFGAAPQNKLPCPLTSSRNCKIAP